MKRTELARFLLLLAAAAWTANTLWGDDTADQTVAVEARSFTIRADWFDCGNAKISQRGEVYADQYACIWNGGVVPNQAEYDLDFPVSADYRIEVLYTAAASRPVDIYLDGKKVYRGVASVTGSWNTSQAKWEYQLDLPVSAGRHTLRLECPGPCLPHICALRFVSSLPLPADWVLDRAVARRRMSEKTPPLPSGHFVPWLDGQDAEDPPGPVEVIATTELRCSPGSRRDELTMTPLPADPSLVAAEWAVRVGRPDDKLSEPVLLGLTPERVESTLQRTCQPIDDFRTMTGVPEDYLQRERADCLARLTTLRDWAGQRSADRWQSLGGLYVSALRLQRRVALEQPAARLQPAVAGAAEHEEPEFGPAAELAEQLCVAGARLR